MGKNTKYISLLAYIFCSLSLLSQDQNDVYLFSLDYLYPQTYFYRFESASKELWSDLDLLLANKDSLEHALNSNYLKNQFYKLHSTAHMLCAHKSEARNYLPDDIEYLIDIVQLLATKSTNLTDLFSKEQIPLADELYQLLYETKMVLESLLMENEEVVLC